MGNLNSRVNLFLIPAVAVFFIIVAATSNVISRLLRTSTNTTEKVAPEQLAERRPFASGNSSPMTASASKISRMCFIRNDYVCLWERDKTDVKRLVPGEQCALSPNGERIAFTENTNPENKVGFPRRIAIFNLASNTVDRLGSLPGEHATNPQWSPDGAKLAFEFSSEASQTRVGILDLPSGQWAEITGKLNSSRTPSDPIGTKLDSWSPAGNSVLIHDMTSLYEVSLTGEPILAIPLQTIADAHEVVISSEMRFIYSPDKRKLAFFGNSEPRTGKTNLALYIYDLDSHRLSRITPESMDASLPAWLPSGQQIIFQRLEDRPDDAAIFDIYVLTLDSGVMVPIIKNGANPSAIP